MSHKELLLSTLFINLNVIAQDDNSPDDDMIELQDVSIGSVTVILMALCSTSDITYVPADSNGDIISKIALPSVSRPISLK